MKPDTAEKSPGTAHNKAGRDDTVVEHGLSLPAADRLPAPDQGREFNQLRGAGVADATRFSEANPNPVLRIAADGRLLYANGASQLLVGAWQVGADGRVPPLWQERISSVLTGGDLRVWDELREGRVYRLSCVPFPAADFVNVYGVDMTDEVALQTELRRLGAQAHDLIRFAPTGIYEVDFRTGRFRSVNDAMCEILGYTREELLTMNASSLLDDEGKALFADRIRRTLAGEQVDPSVEYRVIKRDGSMLYGVLSTRITYSDGEPDGAFVIAHDVTERRRAADELATQREQLREANRRLEARVVERTAALMGANERLRYEASVLANIADAVVVTDKNRRITYINRAAQELTGWTMEEALGHNPVHLFQAEFCGCSDEDFARQVETAGRWQGQALVRRRGGASHYADAAVELLLDENGQFVGHIGVYHDITEHKELETALRAEQEQSRALATRLVEAVENERRSLARELHDQAGQTTWALNLMLGRLRQDLDAGGAHAARFDRIDELVTNVMDELRRLTLNLRPPSLDRAGLLQALREYVEFYRAQSALAVDLVTSDLERRLPADVETAIYRVVQEALTNVVRHASASHVSVTVERRGERVFAAIEDDGQGFEVAAALSSGRLGVLGMRERARSLGGEFRITSAPGKGTTVRFDLPVCADNVYEGGRE
jgi:PAS domain S-box-containing protein